MAANSRAEAIFQCAHQKIIESSKPDDLERIQVLMKVETFGPSFEYGDGASGLVGTACCG